jgi:hypothetical protein
MVVLTGGCQREKRYSSPKVEENRRKILITVEIIRNYQKYSQVKI